MVKMKEFERKQSWPNLAFLWQDRDRTRKICPKWPISMRSYGQQHDTNLLLLIH